MVRNDAEAFGRAAGRRNVLSVGSLNKRNSSADQPRVQLWTIAKISPSDGVETTMVESMSFGGSPMFYFEPAKFSFAQHGLSVI